jgi:glycosyltransferase involved in cell wall biosynthesis
MEKRDKKKFLLIYVAMHTGGIETLILRMTDWLIDNNHEVNILLVKNQGMLMKKINEKANIFSLGSFPEVQFLKNFILKSNKNQYDVIYSFSPLTLWMALLLSQNQKVKPVVLNGVYHLYDFKLFADPYNKQLFDSILPDRFKIFMTPIIKMEHEKILNRKIQNPIIWPLPIKEFNQENIVRVPKLFKIVSIGRLTSFKTYNLYMLDVVNQLLKLNYNVEYYIYGDGELYSGIEKKINELNLKNHVFLCGIISYDKIPEVLSDAYAFIGMGTSVIEAGFCRVPSIVAIAYSEAAITHGFVHELPDFNSGEFIENHTTYNVLDMLKVLFNRSQEEYNQLCNDTYVKLKSDYEINRLMEGLLQKINNFKRNDLVIPKTKMYHLYILKKTYSRVIILIKNFIKSFIK